MLVKVSSDDGPRGGKALLENGASVGVVEYDSSSSKGKARLARRKVKNAR